MDNIWAEIEIKVVVVETCTIVVQVNDPDFTSLSNLKTQAQKAVDNKLAEILSSDPFKLEAYKCSKKVVKYYLDDLTGKPNLELPIEESVIKEFIDDPNPTD